MGPGRRLAGAILCALAAAPVAAASLTGTTGTDTAPEKAHILIARNDGSGVRVLGSGEGSSLSPDDTRVAVIDWDAVRGSFVNQRLKLYAISGGAPTFTLRLNCPRVVWSPDSRRLACVTSGNPGRLVLIDAATGAVTTLAQGFFDTPSFSPDSTKLVFVQRRTGSTVRMAGTLKVMDLATRGVRVLRGAASHPVWGPHAIAFSTVVSQPHYDVLNVALIQPDGSAFRQLTHLRPITYRFAIYPVAWSADGTRLLGGIYGLEAWTLREAYAIDPIKGGFRLIAHSVMPTALSRDGRYVVGQSGDPECCGFKYSNIVRVPWGGGRRQILMRHAMVASFDG